MSRHVTQHLQQTGHRSIALTVAQAQFIPLPPSDSDHVVVTLQRATVQAHMAARYGFTPDASDLNDATPPNATERRITATLEAAIHAAVQALLPAPAAATASALTDAVQPAATQRWQWQACIAIGDLPAQPLTVALDSAHSQTLEALTNRLRKPLPPSQPQLPNVPVTLEAVLLEKTVTAADIQQLQVGSVLPITLERTCVALNGHPMLTASVAEHQGKLHLTAFETLE